MAVADLGHLRIEVGTHDEVGAVLHIKRSRRGVDDRADAENHLGTLLRGELHQLDEDLRSEVAAVGELESAHTSLVAGFEHLLGHVGVGMIKNGNHAGTADGFHDLHF